MCKKNEEEFHQLTKSITNLEIKRAELFLESQKKHKTKYCSLCLCSNAKYKFITDDNKINYLCKYCVKSVKNTKDPLKNGGDKQCPICKQLDGIYIIKNITTSLCDDCFDGIKLIKLPCSCK